MLIVAKGEGWLNAKLSVKQTKSLGAPSLSSRVCLQRMEKKRREKRERRERNVGNFLCNVITYRTVMVKNVADVENSFRFCAVSNHAYQNNRSNCRTC